MTQASLLARNAICILQSMANALVDLVLFVSDRLRIIVMAMVTVAMMKTAIAVTEPPAPAPSFPVAHVTVEAMPSH